MYPVQPPVERIARVITDAYVALGELRPQAAHSLAVQARSSGFVRLFLADANAEESEHFAVALEQALATPGPGGYWISRQVAVPRGLARPLLRQALEAQPHLDVLWTGVPQDLGRRGERRDAYATAWSRWFGACDVRQDEAGLVLAADDAGYDTQMRDLWV